MQVSTVCKNIYYYNNLLSDCIVWDVDQVVILWLPQVMKVMVMMLMIQTNTQNQARIDSFWKIWCRIMSCKLGACGVHSRYSPEHTT